jgi:DNA-binding transcriptional ArsR family regulator
MKIGDKGSCLIMQGLDDRALEEVAVYFRALSVPLRLKILNALRSGERNVTELTDALGCSQANVSKHLSLLARGGLIEKMSRGTSTYYRITDPKIYRLCDLVCGQIGKRFAGQSDLHDMFRAASAPARKPGAARG